MPKSLMIHPGDVRYGEELQAARLCTRDDLYLAQNEIDSAILRAYVRAIDLDISPRADLYAPGCLLERTMFSNGHLESLAPERTSELLLPYEANPRINREGI